MKQRQTKTGRTLFRSLWVCCLLVSCTEDIWNYPLRLGDSVETAHKILGPPENVYRDPMNAEGSIEWFPASGLSVVFDSTLKITKFNFKGNYGHDNWVTSDAKIVFGISPEMDIFQLMDQIGSHQSISKENEASGWHSYKWVKEGYFIKVDVWIKDYEEAGRIYPNTSIKWLTVSSDMPLTSSDKD